MKNRCTGYTGEKRMDTKATQNELLTLIGHFDRICSKYGIWYTLTNGSVLGAIRHKGFIPWDADIDVFVKQKDLATVRNVMKKELPACYHYIEWDKEKGYSLPYDRLAHTCIPHQSMHVDILPIIGAPSDKTLRKLFTTICFVGYKFNHCKYVDTRYSDPRNVQSINRVKVIARCVPGFIINSIFGVLNCLFSLDKAEYCYSIGCAYGYKESMKTSLILDTKRVPFENLQLPVPKRWDEYLTNLYGDYMIPVRYR